MCALSTGIIQEMQIYNTGENTAWLVFLYCCMILTYHGHEVIDGLDPLRVGQQVHDQIPQVSAEQKYAYY